VAGSASPADSSGLTSVRTFGHEVLLPDTRKPPPGFASGPAYRAGSVLRP
jgi:hypothetical protein